jgi:sugar/nucleoside kinase (ribokinase family)
VSGPGNPRGPAPDVVVAGSASRDVAPDDRRGWRLGGGVTYSALAVARLGLSTSAIVGVDELAARAPELDLLREAGVDLQLVNLAHGPVFENIELPEGRRQLALDRSDPIPVSAIPDAWCRTVGWILAPVAGELPEAWASAIPAGAHVALGWQGILREIEPGNPVRRAAPGPNALVSRADLVSISRDDLDPATELEQLRALVRADATLVITGGASGGVVLDVAADGHARTRWFEAIRTPRVVDVTGAGDTFLATLAAVRIQPALVGQRTAEGLDLMVAAAAASLVVERPGLLGVPERSAVRRRLTEARRLRP